MSVYRFENKCKKIWRFVNIKIGRKHQNKYGKYRYIKDQVNNTKIENDFDKDN